MKIIFSKVKRNKITQNTLCDAWYKRNIYLYEQSIVFYILLLIKQWIIISEYIFILQTNSF